MEKNNYCYIVKFRRDSTFFHISGKDINEKNHLNFN